MVSIDRSTRIAARYELAAAPVVAGLAVAASAGSLVNGFALDDVPIIAENEAIHSLTNIPRLLIQAYWPPEFGPSLYRPFTSIAFALQWALGGGSPLVFHLVSIMLYVATSLLVLRVARQVMKATAAFIAAAIFAVHPLHVEAVANVVGQAELWAAVLLLVALTRCIECMRAKAVRSIDVAIISALFGAALMFKEHAIILPAVVLAAAVILPSDDALRGRIRRLVPLLAAMGVVAVSFVGVRTLVLGRFAGGSTATVFVEQDYAARLFTMLNVIPEWLRLFAWPANLSADYSPPRIETATSFETAMLPGVLVIVAAALIAIRSRRDNAALTFSLSLAGLALLIPSNLVIVTGFVLAERSLFLPSVGVAMVLGLGFAALLHGGRSLGLRRLLQGALASLLVLGVLRSLDRSAVWRNNETLFRQTVLDVPASYRAHLMLGELLWEKGEKGEALTELARAVRLSRKRDYYVRWLAADRFHAAGQLEVASRFYKEALTLKPTDQKVRYGAAMALLAQGHGGEARELAVAGVQRDPADPRFRRIVHVLDSVAALQPGG
jgi:tetratricopeptide (TPR) repeat protein